MVHVLFVWHEAHIFFIYGTGPLWVAHGSYYSQMGMRYGQLTGQDTSRTIAKFFSIFGFIIEIGKFWFIRYITCLSNISGNILFPPILTPLKYLKRCIHQENEKKKHQQIVLFLKLSDRVFQNMLSSNRREHFVVDGTHQAS